MADVTCAICEEPIRSRSDLIVVTNLLFRVRPICRTCYDENFRGLPRYGKSIVNTPQSLVQLIVGIAVWGGLMAWIGGGWGMWPLWAVFVVPWSLAAAVRLYSYLRFERPLPVEPGADSGDFS